MAYWFVAVLVDVWGSGCWIMLVLMVSIIIFLLIAIAVPEVATWLPELVRD